MRLTKQQLIEEAIKYRDTINAIYKKSKNLKEDEAGFFNIEKSEIEKIVEQKYDLYCKCVDEIDKTNKQLKILEEITTAHPYPNSSELRSSESSKFDISETEEAKQKNIELYNSLFNGKRGESYEKQLNFGAELLHEINLSEISEATLDPNKCVDYVHNHTTVGFYGYTAAYLAKGSIEHLKNAEVLNDIPNTQLNINVLNDYENAISLWGSQVQKDAGFLMHQVELNASPLAMLFEEKTPNITNEQIGELYIAMMTYKHDRGDSDEIVTDFDKNLKRTFIAYQQNSKTYFEEQKQRHDFFVKNKITNNYLNYEAEPGTNLDNAIKNDRNLKRISEDKITNLDKVVHTNEKLSLEQLNTLGPSECAKHMNKEFKTDYAKFPNNNNQFKTITKNDLKESIDNLVKLSNIHFSRTKPSRLAFIRGTEEAKNYAAERKVMDKYSNLLKKFGFTKENINSFIGKRGGPVGHLNPNIITDQKVNNINETYAHLRGQGEINKTDLLTLDAYECTKFMKNRYENDKRDFDTLNNTNKELNGEILKKSADNLVILSKAHNERKAPSIFASIFGSQSAKDYAKEEKLIQNYQRLLMRNGVSKVIINRLINSKNSQPLTQEGANRVAELINASKKDKQSLTNDALNNAFIIHDEKQAEVFKKAINVDEMNDGKSNYSSSESRIVAENQNVDVKEEVNNNAPSK